MFSMCLCGRKLIQNPISLGGLLSFCVSSLGDLLRSCFAVFTAYPSGQAGFQNDTKILIINVLRH